MKNLQIIRDLVEEVKEASGELSGELRSNKLNFNNAERNKGYYRESDMKHYAKQMKHNYEDIAKKTKLKLTLIRLLRENDELVNGHAPY